MTDTANGSPTYPTLTSREMEVLAELHRGSPLAAIAQEMSIREDTVLAHIRVVGEKLELIKRRLGE